MSKKRYPWLDFLVYAAVRLFVSVMQATPMSVGYRVAGRLAHFVYWVNPRHRNVALENIRRAYGSALTDSQRQRMVLGVYEHFIAVLVEMMHAPRRLRCGNYKRYISMENVVPVVDCLLDRSRPCFVATGHVGNWEITGFLFAAIGVRSFTIARRIDNPYLDRFLQRFREYTGQTMLSKNHDYDRILQVLGKRQTLVALGDQSAGPRGYFVDFFGRPASTNRAIALLALEYDAPIVVAFGCRIGRGFQYLVGCAGLVDPRDYSDFPDAAVRITAEYTRLLETVVRRFPQQYFWVHNRWKQEPPVRKKRAA